ncbi:DedA family protein [Roseisalinus antarcticus]|uniref:VTT domain-containing protein n=1 Tax=Roseisalinus antarcticus TaxID=254357 RepID=A0A1Y5SAZ4_9RHOB|nr:VTT domain-containing protein [Roseisalinus antarcticus]SLN35418.1 hypothetical protein ROA7023_01287 [Roseisalinus antarcticus]
MTDWLLALVPHYGALLLTVAIFLSCFALPVPASILMLAAGGFTAVGDLGIGAVAGGALLGVAAGDHSVYALGRLGGARLAARLESHGLLRRAETMLAERGGVIVFLSRWLFSPVGPYVNFAAGAARQPWGSFALWGLAGELVWIGIYLGIGYGFAGQLEEASATAFNAIAAIGAGAIALGLGYWLFSSKRRNAVQG